MIPSLKAVPHGIQQHIIAGVAAVAFIPQHHGGPLLIRHGSGAGIGKHIHRKHGGGESKFIVMGGFQGPLPLLYGDFGNVADHIGEMMRNRYVQRIAG